MGQLVGFCVELGITELLVFVLHRHRIRSALDLLLKELMDQRLLRILRPGLVEAPEHLIELVLRQNRQRQQGLFRSLLQRIDDLLYSMGHIVCDPAGVVPRLRLNLRRYRKALSQIIH